MVTYTSDAKKGKRHLPLPSADAWVSNHSPPPAPRPLARSKCAQSPQEIVPDSDPERAQNNGDDGNDNTPELSVTESQESDMNEENRDASEEENINLDPEALAEMEMDAFANDFEDNPTGPDHDQDTGSCFQTYSVSARLTIELQVPWILMKIHLMRMTDVL